MARGIELELSAEADADIDDAAAWYFEQDLDLGVRFAVEVRRVLDQIVEHPLAWTEIEPGIRRAVLRRFAPLALLRVLRHRG